MAEKEEKLQFLGLGSVVEIEHMDALTDTLYFIVARAVGKDSSGQTILRYQVAPHPFGATPSQQIVTLAETDIIKVVHEGYQDNKDDSFLTTLLEKMAGASHLPKKEKLEDPHSKNIEVKPPKLQDEKEILKRDPFYKFKK
ncbi:DUF4176 domain-containing protein [Lactococcus garvieae]|uniref:DUF4176 domain-containing protein n=1 Tax=Lactococcus garvieae TaxID=1363 RepID=UPI00254E24A9|nr:DUF4176 domain-containing protein [Lactococcus garvieae]